jgi:hypothetical protein
MNPDAFKSVRLYIQALQLTSNYSFKLTTYRFVQDLFDIYWDEHGFRTLEKMHGLNLTSVLSYDSKFTGKEQRQLVPTTLNSNSRSEKKFVPTKIIKGF